MWSNKNSTRLYTNFDNKEFKAILNYLISTLNFFSNQISCSKLFKRILLNGGEFIDEKEFVSLFDSAFKEFKYKAYNEFVILNKRSKHDLHWKELDANILKILEEKEMHVFKKHLLL